MRKIRFHTASGDTVDNKVNLSDFMTLAGVFHWFPAKERLDVDVSRKWATEQRKFGNYYEIRISIYFYSRGTHTLNNEWATKAWESLGYSKQGDIWATFAQFLLLLNYALLGPTSSHPQPPSSTTNEPSN